MNLSGDTGLSSQTSANLFCAELLLHQLWDQGGVVGFHSRLHFGVLHVFGLENVIHSWEEAAGHTNKHMEGCSVTFVAPPGTTTTTTTTPQSPQPKSTRLRFPAIFTPEQNQQHNGYNGPQWERCFAASNESSRSD